MKKNWEREKLGNIIKFVGGGTPSKSVVEYWNGNVPWASVKDFKSEILYSTKYSNTELGVRKSSVNIAEKGELLLVTRMSPGVTAITDIRTAINQDIKIVRPISKISVRYLHYYFKSIKGKIDNLSSGSTVKGISIEKLNDLYIHFPDFDEQEMIANILDKAQLLVEKRREAIAKLDELVQALFLDMFGDLNCNSKKFEIGKLEEYTTHVSSGSTPKGGQSTYLNSGIPLIRSQNVLMNKLVLDDVAFISDETHQNMKRSQLMNNDVLLNITGASIGRVAVYEGENYGANVNQHVCIIRLTKELEPYYVSYYISSQRFQHEIKKLNSGATREALNYSQIKNFSIIIPPKETQNDFKEVVQKIECQRTAMVKSLRNLELNFQSLLQKNFKGELKVNTEITA